MRSPRNNRTALHRRWLLTACRPFPTVGVGGPIFTAVHQRGQRPSVRGACAAAAAERTELANGRALRADGPHQVGLRSCCGWRRLTGSWRTSRSGAGALQSAMQLFGIIMRYSQTLPAELVYASFAAVVKVLLSDQADGELLRVRSSPSRGRVPIADPMLTFPCPLEHLCSLATVRHGRAGVAGASPPNGARQLAHRRRSNSSRAPRPVCRQAHAASVRRGCRTGRGPAHLQAHPHGASRHSNASVVVALIDGACTLSLGH